MAVALRLMRFGKKGYPTYRIVALDRRNKRDGYYIEKIGLYNPMTDNNQIILNEERFSYWVTNGAQVSDGLRKLFSSRLPKLPSKVSKRKLNHLQKAKLNPPKAETAAPAPAAESPTAEVPAAPEAPVTEAPVEEVKAEEVKSEEVKAEEPKTNEPTAQAPEEAAQASTDGTEAAT
ncbi:MAG: 30S ribosomal protein S16, partial [Patescibacteria group bacterium]